MRQFSAIFRKEMKMFFAMPSSFVVMAFFMATAGFFFYNLISYFALQCSQAADYETFYGIPLPPMSTENWVIKPFFMNIATLVLFLVPILTMRSFAAEKQFGTAELLLTSPLKLWQILWGKFVAHYVIFLVFLLLTVAFFGMAQHFSDGSLDWNLVLTGYAGLAFLGLAIVPVGMFFSSTTQNQIIAAFLSFAVLLLLWIVDFSAIFSSGTLAKVIGYVGISSHVKNFTRGIVDTSDIVYFVSFTILGLFGCARSLELWRHQ